jgi:hypothetical protein
VKFTVSDYVAACDLMDCMSVSMYVYDAGVESWVHIRFERAGATAERFSSRTRASIFSSNMDLHYLGVHATVSRLSMADLSKDCHY